MNISRCMNSIQYYSGVSPTPLSYNVLFNKIYESSRLLPTLARWGFVEATLVIRENTAAIDALVDVFKSGGGVGDAISAIERTVSSSPDSAFMMSLLIEGNQDLRSATTSALRKVMASLSSIPLINL